MLDAVYIGNGPEATGFALVGIRARPSPNSRADLLALVEDERSIRDLLILSAGCARAIEPDLERLLARQPLPPVVVLPDLDEEAHVPAAVGAAYAALGIEAPGQ